MADINVGDILICICKELDIMPAVSKLVALNNKYLITKIVLGSFYIITDDGSEHLFPNWCANGRNFLFKKLDGEA